LSIGYGAEAGQMDKLISDMCARFVHDSLVITRNPESQTVLGKLGISTELGTDTAWTFEPYPDAYGRKALRDVGWDEKTPVLILCPIHPFVWPVKASIAKYIARVTTGAYKESQYRTVYFHASGPENDRKFKHYIDGFVSSTRAFQQKHKVFTVLAATERLDAVACRAIAEQIPGLPIFTSDDFDMYQLVSILRQASYMVSSRYHGIVTCMPALVASAGVTMDERIRNLMRERGHNHLCVTVDDPDLGPKMLQMMETLVAESESIRQGIGDTVVRNLKVMARMGVIFEDLMRRQYPGFPLRDGVRSWEEYLPPLSENLVRLAEKYDVSETATAASK
jgi:polysaccharide pyruvyl transferase WcaK-like protein